MSTAAPGALGVLRGHTESVVSIDFAECNSIAISGSIGGIAKIWKLNEYRCFRTISAHDGSVLSIYSIGNGSFLRSHLNKSSRCNATDRLHFYYIIRYFLLL
jgi:WD40 repeat protein